MRRALVRALILWAALSVVGVVVVAVPDAGPRLLTLSETHGPSAPDLVGIALLLIGWAVFLRAVWRARRAVRAPALPVALVVAAAAGVTAWSVLTDTGAWWLLGAVALVGVQVWLALSAAAVLDEGRAA